jgi:hypothetical protein
VVDADHMLVGIEESPVSDSPYMRSVQFHRRHGIELSPVGEYRTWVLLKCPTAGITDDMEWQGHQWKGLTGSEYLVVTGTTTYPTVAGGTKTVFVVEPLDLDSLKQKK